MSMEKLEELLHDITLGAVTQMTDGDVAVDEFLESLREAIGMRKVIELVQFEGIQRVAGEGDEPDVLAIDFKLAPAVCVVAYEAGSMVSDLIWSLLLPEPGSLDGAERPETSFAWLELSSLWVDEEYADYVDILSQIITRIDTDEDDGGSLH